MVKRLLVANRGEIACRIIKTAKRMGLTTVAIYSEADANSLHIHLADKAVYIGEAPSTQSYLNPKRILDAIKISGADAVHPGYGFLSENYEFAKLLEKHGITFVGPSPESIKAMGDKISAKKLAKAAGVNIVPGYIGNITNEKQAIKIANKVGYPIMLKAAAGGGGKGMRVVHNDEEMIQAFSSTRYEAQSNFADSRTFIEKFIENPRHIEIQVLADKYGNCICLGERECSIQRHNQKVIEEAPSPFLTDKVRKKMYAQSKALVKKVKYFSAGTIEYIMDENKNFYFLEMNTRLQVEHPVTELVTGFDIVEQMVRIARGEKLTLKQKDIDMKGWAIECRVYAEDPSCGFLPSTGRVTTYREPEGSKNVRVDSGIYEGGEVSMFYDPMISKICTYSDSREETINLMQEALSKYVIRGISNNISLLQAILSNKRFLRGDLSTNFLEEEFKGGFTGSVLSSEESAVILSAAAFIFMQDAKRAASITGQVRGRSRAIGTRWVIRLDDKNYPVTIRPIEDGYKIAFESRRLYIKSKWHLGNKLFQCKVNGKGYNLQVENKTEGLALTFMGSTVHASIFTPRAAELSKFMKVKKREDTQKDLIANISGMLTGIKVNPGDKLVKGQVLATIEAMKMENTLTSPIDGIAKKINYKAGDTVSSGEIIVEIEPAES